MSFSCQTWVRCGDVASVYSYGCVTETRVSYILALISSYICYNLHSMEQVVAEFCYDTVNIYTSLSITANMCKQCCLEKVPNAQACIIQVCIDKSAPLVTFTLPCNAHVLLG
jgi:hypothetical protein